MDTELDVVPINDIKEHTSGKSCWCHPSVDIDADTEHSVVIWVHNAGDGREQYEVLQ